MSLNKNHYKLVNYLFIAGILLSLSRNSFANYQYGIGLENMTFLSNEYQIDDSGGDELFSINPGVRGEYYFPFLNRGWSLGLSLFLPKSSDDSLYSTTLLKTDLQTNVGRFLGLVFFGGLNFNTLVINGTGEQLVLQNGDSSSSFYGPSEMRLNYFFTPELGVKKYFNNIIIKFSVSILDSLESEKRSYNHFLTGVWRL
tara:strand:+ start:297 stop:893 length:597 start_codon:yes stop_codon:yes gene_type:complete